ncbi:unnamed protein product (macronuclear) [Paramecium tetraurelia]|uniref:Protein kinase domain-containing protein n=1 Tax=Paramecium tetraurelia TaxID=5888 RepID=A0CDX7_PARTE|nr:uncharacterized protein GSPATT00007206001 [Paramecium tetraurelia]CAK68994.1 unnamed protein product [Paramecium tetraurelia]|eukprot:XP_001436391.1 hypothetical protein (macronuclear) [Paramecium tetraurelia strain d4-2]
MSRFSLKFQLSETNSGTLYQMEEESDQRKETFYAYDFSSEFKDQVLKDEESLLINCNSVRHFVEQIMHQNKKYYLFKFLEGQTLDKEIQSFRGKKQSIKLDTIKLYLTQILETLYQLHQKQILGRVFSTKNIMVCDGQIVFMDFGFGPKFLTANLDLIAPPEIIEKFVENQPIESNYDIKVDSWLLGAVLFHLAKLRPISHIVEENRVKIMVLNDIKEYSEYLKIQMQGQGQGWINAKTDRYPEEFCQFIQGLLTYKPQDRFSFKQIYENSFIKSLNLAKQQEYLTFYTNLQSDWVNQQIGSLSNSYVETKDLQKQQSHIATQRTRQVTPPNSTTPEHSIQIPYLELKSNLASQSIQIPGTTSRDKWPPEIIKSEYIENSFIYQIQDLNQSKFYEIWSNIRMELFRSTFLEKCADEFVVELGKKKKYKLEHLLAYFLRKMAYLVLVELQNKLKEDVCPWRCTNESLQKWKDFQSESQVMILKNSIAQKIKDLAPNLNKQFYDQCQKFKNEENIDEEIRKQLQEDNSCFQSYIDENSYLYKCCSDEFLRNGFRKLLQLTLKFLQTEQKFGLQPQINYNTLLLKILLCHLINRIFNFSIAQITFKELLKNRVSDTMISPNEIYAYICRDDEHGKEEDIRYISNQSFTEK